MEYLFSSEALHALLKYIGKEEIFGISQNKQIEKGLVELIRMELIDSAYKPKDKQLVFLNEMLRAYCEADIYIQFQDLSFGLKQSGLTIVLHGINVDEEEKYQVFSSNKETILKSLLSNKVLLAHYQQMQDDKEKFYWEDTKLRLAIYDKNKEELIKIVLEIEGEKWYQLGEGWDRIEEVDPYNIIEKIINVLPNEYKAIIKGGA